MKLNFITYRTISVYFCFMVFGCNYSYHAPIINTKVPKRVSSENDKYQDLLVQCQNDRVQGTRSVSIEIITNVVDSVLMSKYESPLNHVANAGIANVVWYGDIVFSNIVNTSCFTQKVNQVCDIGCWLIYGFRRENYLDLRIAAISCERKLLLDASRESALNPSLCSLFARSWLPETAAFIEYKYNILKELCGKEGVLKNIDNEFVRIIQKAKMSTISDSSKLLGYTKKLRIQIESTAPSFYSKQLSSLIDMFLMPDLELHTLKLYRQKAEPLKKTEGSCLVEEAE